MPGKWRKILEKKTEVTYAPKAGDWAAMEGMLNNDPVLGAGKGSGGMAIWTWTVIAVLGLTAGLIYFSQPEASGEFSEYYELRSGQIDPALYDQNEEQFQNTRVAQIDAYKDENASDLTGVNSFNDNGLVAEQSNRDSGTQANKLKDQELAEAEGEAVDPDLAQESTISDSERSNSIPSTDPSAAEGASVAQESQIAQGDEQVEIEGAPVETDVEDDDTQGRMAAGILATGTASDINQAPVENSANLAQNQDQNEVLEQEGEILQTQSESNADLNLGEGAAEDLNTDQSDLGESDEFEEDDELKPSGSTELNNDEDEEEEDSDVLMSALKRLQFNSISAHVNYEQAADLKTFYGLGGALEAEWRLNNWMFQTGLNYQIWMEQSGSAQNQIIGIDTSYNMNIDSIQVSWVDSIWVVTGVNQGAYAYDTNTATIIDTSFTTIVDTNVINTEHPKPAMRVSSRFSVPILISYRQRLGNFYFDAGAGILGSYTNYQSDYALDLNRSSWSVDVNLVPKVGYQIGTHWSIEGRFNYMIPLYQGAADKQFYNRSKRWNVGLGVRYFFN